MVSRVLFAGGRLDSLEVLVTGATESNSSTLYRDATYVDANIAWGNGVSGDLLARFRDASFAPVSVGAGSAVWAHWVFGRETNSNQAVRNVMELQDSDGYPWVALRSPTINNSAIGLYVNTGTGPSPVWTLVGSTGVTPVSTRATFDIRVTIDADGDHTVALFRANVLTASGPFTQPLMTNLAGAVFRGNANATGAQCYVNQILMTEDLSTIGANVSYRRATAAGSSSTWSGAVGDINAAVDNTSTVNSTTTADARQTYAMGDIAVPGGNIIAGVWHWMTARNDGAAPSNIKSVVRSSGTDYVSSNLSGVGLGFGPVGARYDVDPATGVAWTESGWNAAEVGFQSAT